MLHKGYTLIFFIKVYFIPATRPIIIILDELF